MDPVMETHPLTRLTNWFVDHLRRNRREWATAYICMFGFWSTSFGHWNLALLAGAVVGARLSRHKVVARSARRAFDWCFDMLDAAKRRRLLKGGVAAMIKRFPVSNEKNKQHLLSHHVVRDEAGKIIYEFRILATAEGNARGAHNLGVIQVGVIALNRQTVHSLAEVVYLKFNESHHIHFRIGSLDPEAFKIADEIVTINLLEPDSQPTFYTVRKRASASPAGKPAHISLISAAIKGIREQKLRGAAARILAAAGTREEDLRALRKDLARLLHPDLSRSASAGKALASINAALDTADKQFA